jgi:molybdopterin-guanine dinucleotide biosynthesis protein MobB
MLADLPVFGIFGHHDSGKTTVIDAVARRFAGRGLAVAVAKPGAGHLDVDRTGKDSDRFFRAGADVFIGSQEQGFARTHPPSGAGEAGPVRMPLGLVELARRYDLVLVEGRRALACPKVWLLGEGESAPPEGAAQVVATLGREVDRRTAVGDIIERWLPEVWLRPPVYGGVLIGGASTRMGRSKHLIETAGRTWLERTMEVLATAAERVVVLGGGALPPALEAAQRLPDAPGVEGPLAGILAAMRWAPAATWLIAACDMPEVRPGALQWLLATREPGVWATLPRLPGRPAPEPLLAHYDFRARLPLEGLARSGPPAPSRLADHPKAVTPEPPAELHCAWDNLNTPADLSERLTREQADPEN